MAFQGGRTITLFMNEIRMMWNDFIRTITTPSMLLFYCIMIGGSFFITWVITSIGIVDVLIQESVIAIADILPPESVLTALGLFMTTAIVGGYFGLGPIAVLQTSDEYVLMPAPIRPHQLFLSRYIRRIIRKFAMMFIALLVMAPLFNSPFISMMTVFSLLIILIVFLEINYLLSSVAFYLRLKSRNIRPFIFRGLLLLLFPLFSVILTLPEFNTSTVAVAIIPSNSIGLLMLDAVGLIWLGDSVFGLFLIVGSWCLSLYLLTALLSTTDYYETYTSRQSQENSDSRIVRIIRGEIDFSSIRFEDPMLWIMAKDFWIRMRSSLQFWKYMSIIFGTIMGILLWVVRPQILPLLEVGGLTALVAVLLMDILLVQLVSMTSLLSFVDEKDNIYLLKASPFRRTDIILAKYIGSVLEAGFALIPFLLFLSYIFSGIDTFPILLLALPLLLVFSAVGVMIGAYVPVFTNEPQHTPVPLIFAFPVIGLSMGFFIISFLFWLPIDRVLIALPVAVVGFVSFFLLLALRALRTYK